MSEEFFERLEAFTEAVNSLLTDCDRLRGELDEVRQDARLYNRMAEVAFDSGHLSLTDAINAANRATKAEAELEEARDIQRLLIDRLDDFQSYIGTESAERQWHNHVAPAIARARQASSPHPNNPPEGEP